MKDILAFLQQLSQHNNKEWMTEHKSIYLDAKGQFLEIVEQLIVGVAGFDSDVTGLSPKDCIFRINRDMRFSKDKSPYKINFGAAITPGGKKSHLSTYFINIQPEGSFIAGGVYMPEADNLAKIRQEIDYNPSELRNIVTSDEFSQMWGSVSGEELKRAPKGYPVDHPNIDLLRKKSFTVMKSMKDAEVLSKGFIDQTKAAFQVLYPFNQYFSVAMS